MPTGRNSGLIGQYGLWVGPTSAPVQVFDSTGNFVGASSGKKIFLNPTVVVNGDGSVGTPFNSFTSAWAAVSAGKNDTICLVSDGATTSTLRLSANFDWNKAATHLVGLSSGVNISNRSRIAPPTAGTTFANFFTVSASGCRFDNLQWFHGFTAGGAAAICLTVTGGRNLFTNCHVAGMGSTDHADADDTGSRNLKISGTGENQFVNCTIGLDTVARTVANASVEFAGATPRNEFINCTFPFFATNNAVLGILGTGNDCIDRFELFDKCMFINSVKSGAGVAMTALGSLPRTHREGWWLSGTPYLSGRRSEAAQTSSLTLTSTCRLYQRQQVGWR